MTSTTTRNATQRQSLPDHASDHDSRGLPIDKVGIRDLDYPIVVLDKRNERQATVAKISASVGLPAELRGTHMSRFVEVLNAVRGEITVRNIPHILRALQSRLETDDVQLDIEFPYFISKQAPVSRAESLMKYDCGFHAHIAGEHVDFVLSVRVPVTTLCPCSKAISKYGAHNQRGMVDVRIRSKNFAWIEDIVAIVESCASAPLYALLKREDEKAVTEQAYENPRFVEDLIREVANRLRDQAEATWIQLAVENAESIHAHAAFAELTWHGNDREPHASLESALSRVPRATQTGAAASTFGVWLQAAREARGYKQAEFAKLLDVSASHLSRIERDEKHPSIELATTIASVLGHDPRAVRVRAGYLDPQSASIVADSFAGFEDWLAAQAE